MYTEQRRIYRKIYTVYAVYFIKKKEPEGDENSQNYVLTDGTLAPITRELSDSKWVQNFKNGSLLGLITEIRLV